MLDWSDGWGGGSGSTAGLQCLTGVVKFLKTIILNNSKYLRKASKDSFYGLKLLNKNCKYQIFLQEISNFPEISIFLLKYATAYAICTNP